MFTPPLVSLRTKASPGAKSSHAFKSSASFASANVVVETTAGGACAEEAALTDSAASAALRLLCRDDLSRRGALDGAMLGANDARTACMIRVDARVRTEEKGRATAVRGATGSSLRCRM